MPCIYQRSPDHAFHGPAPSEPHYHGWTVHGGCAMFAVPLRFATAPFFRRDSSLPG